MTGGNNGSEAAASGGAWVRLDVALAGWVCCKAQRCMSDDPGNADASAGWIGAGDSEDEETGSCSGVDAAGWPWSPHAASVVHTSTTPNMQSILI